MAASTEQAKLINKLKMKTKGAWNESRSVDARAKGSQLPGGIINGVAKLSSWKMGEDKNGNVYFMINGIVVEPSEYAGQRATVSHFISETKTKTVKQKLDALSSDLQLLRPGSTEGTDIDDVPGILAELCEEQRHFYFNTWKPENGDTMVFIQKAAPEYDGISASDTPSESAEALQGGDQVDAGETVEEVVEEVVEEAVDDAAPPWAPQVGEEYVIKGKKVKITAVDEANQTVNATIVGTRQGYKAVGWDALESAQ